MSPVFVVSYFLNSEQFHSIKFVFFLLEKKHRKKKRMIVGRGFYPFSLLISFIITVEKMKKK